jgi:hypothetical protein
MRDQLAFMAETAEAGNAMVQVVNFAVGAHEGMRGSFTILEFDERFEGPFDLTIADVVYWEGPHGDNISEEPALVREQVNLFHRLSERALPLTESLQFMWLSREDL